MSPSRVPPEEVVARGEEIYWRDIHEKLPPGSKGKFVVIDVETGGYELDSSDAEATFRLLAKNPGTLTYAVRVGSPVAYRLGLRLMDVP